MLNCINGDNQSAAHPAGAEAAAAKFDSSEDPSSWRNFCYEQHPLHAATSAMLNLSEGANGLGADEAAPQGNPIAFHEQYLSKIQSHNASAGSLASAYTIVHYPHKDAKQASDMWK